MRDEPDPWQLRALCRSSDPAIFFADDPTRAQEICAGCPVSRPCLETALEIRPVDYDCGVWGGTTRADRDKIRKARRKGLRP